MVGPSPPATPEISECSLLDMNGQTEDEASQLTRLRETNFPRFNKSKRLGFPYKC